LLAQGKDAEAAENFRAELALDPGNHLALFQLGTWQLRQGRADAAIRSLKAAQNTRPDFVPGLVELGKALLQAKQPAGALTYLRAAIDRQPDHPSAHYLLYRTYQLTGAKDKAAAHLTMHRALLQRRGAADSAGMR
jgi:predicted Zn-dependent protease